MISPGDFEKLGLAVSGTVTSKGMANVPLKEYREDDDLPEFVKIGTKIQESISATPAQEETPWEVAPQIPQAPAFEPEPTATDAEVSLAPESEPVEFKAAKAREGAAAVRQTQEFIEHLDGEDQGFLDAAEIQRTIQIVAELQEEIRKLTARMEALEKRLK